MVATRVAARGLVAFALGACGGEPAVPDAPVPDAPAPDVPPPDAAIDAPMLCDSEPRDDTYVPGLTKIGAHGYRVVLESSTPGPPRRGNNDWVVQVLDPASAPRDGLVIEVVPYMPDHGHGTAVQAIVTALGGGRYRIAKVNLFMSGYWTIRLGLVDSAMGPDELDDVTFAFCVNFS